MTMRAAADDLVEDRATEMFRAMFTRWSERADQGVAAGPKGRRRSHRRAGMVSLRRGAAEIAVERA